MDKYQCFSIQKYIVLLPKKELIRLLLKHRIKRSIDIHLFYLLQPVEKLKHLIIFKGNYTDYMINQLNEFHYLKKGKNIFI